MRSLFLTACALICAGCSLPAQNGASGSANSKSGRTAVAVVDGKTVYEEELAPRIQGELQRLRTEEYELKRRTLNEMIDAQLLEAEAKKRGISSGELMDKEIMSGLAEPSDAEVRAIYDRFKDRIGRPYEQVAGQIKQDMMKQQGEQRLQDFVAKLREKSDVAILLDPPRVDVEADPKRLLGPKDAPVTLVEFSDYQCPFCLRVQPTIKALREKYKDKVAFGFRDFPLQSIHARATRAAAAARCAADQGKFWPYHDLLFTNVRNLEEEHLRQYASQAGLKTDQFDSCLESGKFEMEVQKDLSAGSKLGVNGTPAFFINGIMLSGAQPLEAFEEIIDAELARAARKN